MTVVASDTFDRANQIGLGDASGGGTWVEHSGTWAISGNAAVSSTTPGVATLDAGVSDAQVSAGVNVPAAGNIVFGLVVRATDAATHLGAEIVRTSGEQRVILYRRIAGVDREIGAAGIAISAGAHTLDLIAVDENVVLTYDGVQMINSRLSPDEQGALTGTRVGLVSFDAEPTMTWTSFEADDSPGPQVPPPINATFNASDRAWLESIGSINGWHEWRSSSPSWQIIGNQAAQLSTQYSVITTWGQEVTGTLGMDAPALGTEFWLLFRAEDDQSYYRFGRSGGGNYTVEKIINNSVQPITGGSFGTTVTPAAGDRLEVEENGPAGFACYVIQGVDRILNFSATDSQLAEFSPSLGLAAFNSPTLRIDNVTFIGSAEPIEGAGALTAPPALLAGAGETVTDGAGALLAPPGVLDGDAQSPAVGSGALTAAAGILSGAGADAASGSGGLTAAPARLDGVGASPITGAGGLVAPAGVLAGEEEGPSIVEDLVALPVMLTLAQCLCQEIFAAGLPEPCFCGIVGGQEAVFDYCSGCGGDRCGAAWVRLVAEYPTVQFPAQADGIVADATCGATSAVVLEAGIVRCAPLPKTVAKKLIVPTMQEQFNSVMQVTADKAAIRRAIQCCMTERGPDNQKRQYVLGQYAPISQGDCVGGAWTVTVRSKGVRGEWPRAE